MQFNYQHVMQLSRNVGQKEKEGLTVCFQKPVNYFDVECALKRGIQENHPVLIEKDLISILVVHCDEPTLEGERENMGTIPMRRHIRLHDETRSKVAGRVKTFTFFSFKCCEDSQSFRSLLSKVGLNHMDLVVIIVFLPGKNTCDHV